MTNVQVKCNCGKMANETDWNNEAESEMLYKKFGSLDDYYFFICECGEITRMHYTGYDCLLEELEYAEQMNDDVKVLSDNGFWVFESTTKDVYTVNEVLTAYAEIGDIDNGYEEFTFYRKGADFKQVVFNPVHKTFGIYNYKAKPEGMQNLINHFFK